MDEARVGSITLGAAPLRVGGALLAAAACQTAVEVALVGGSTDPGALLWGRGLPALAWAAAAPGVVALGARLRVARPARARPLALHAAAFLAFFFATNAALRLPLAARGGPGALAEGLGDAWVRFGPAALLLWVALALLGAWRAGAGAEAGGAQAATDGTLPRPEEAPVAGVDGSDGVPPPPAALPVPGLNRVRLVPLDAIRWIEADGDHVRVHTATERGTLRMRSTLTEVEAALGASPAFLRIHRSSLVHAARVREVQPLGHGDWVAILDDGTELRIPRTRRAVVDALLGGNGAGAG